MVIFAVVVAFAAAQGTFRPFEHRVEELTFAQLERPASGQVHVVEMDAASMAAIQSWPWPRDHYARVLQQLDAAGARSISFDIDFSGKGDSVSDLAFGAAIAAADTPVALPTFAQKAGFHESRQLDSLPIAPLRGHAHLASVVVTPDADGFVRRMPFGSVTNSLARPSIATFVAGRAGAAGESFPIDFAVDPASIPRHSFISIERGMFRPELFKGKDIIIGATAIELGDRYPVPRHGVIPGVIVQALAAETLVDAVPIYGGWAAPLLLAVMMAVLVGAAQSRVAVLTCAALGTAIIMALWLGARMIGAVWFEIVPALIVIGTAVAVRLPVLAHKAAVRRRRIDTESGLPNRLALDARRVAADDRYVIAAQIHDFDGLKLAVGADHAGELLRRLFERLQVATSTTMIYRMEDRTLVWLTPLEIHELEPLMAGLRAIMRSPFDVAGRRLGVSLTFGVAAADLPGAAGNAAHAASLA